jgi:hypothetical protein
MKLLLVLGMMYIVHGFPMLRNIKEYDGEIILYYNESNEIYYAIEKQVKIYKGEISNIVFKVGITSTNIELVSADIKGTVIPCKKKDLYFECSYTGNDTDINLNVKNLTNTEENKEAKTQEEGTTKEEPTTLAITDFIMLVPKVTKCTVKIDDNINVSEGIVFTIDIGDSSIKSQNINLISTTPQTYISCKDNGKCTLYNSGHTGNIIRYFNGKEYIICGGDNLSTGSQYENNHSTLIHIPSILVSVVLLFTMI